MTEPPRPDDQDSSSDGSAPWERPRRWSDEGLDATRVDDLLARLGNSDEFTPRRSRRRQEQENQERSGADPDSAPDSSAATAPSVPASDLIAALSGRPTFTTPDESGEHATVESGQADRDPAGAGDAAQAPDEHNPAPNASVEQPVAPEDPAPTPSLAVQPPLRRVTMPGPGAQDDAGDDAPTDLLPQYTDDIAAIRASLSGEVAQQRGDGPVGPPPVVPPRATGGDGDRPDHRRRNLGFLVAGRSLIAAAAVVLLLFSGYQWRTIDKAEQGLQDHQDQGVTLPPNTASGAPTFTAPRTTTNETGQQVVMYPPQNILLLGSDSRAGDNGNSANSDETTEDSANSDTMMIAHIAGDRQTVSILTFPRYLDIAAPTCKTWDFKTRKLSDYTQPVDDSSRWRISNAYAVGGPACSVAALTKLTGIHIDRVIDIDFAGFQAMVDGLNGITVNICRPIIDAELHTVAASGGVQVIHGAQALDLVRARKVEGDSSGTDGRMRRQQVVLAAMLRQVTSAGTMLNPVALNKFLTAFIDNTHTVNVDLDSLILLATQLGDLAPGKVNFYSVPHHPSPTKADWDELDKSAEAIFAAIRNDERLPTLTTPDSNTGDTGASTTSGTSSSADSPSSSSRPPATTSSSSSVATTSSTATSISEAPQTLTVDPAQIDLQVVNETGRGGVATTTMNALNEGGYAITGDDLLLPAGQVVEATTVEYSGDNRAAAVTVAAAVPGSSLVEVDGLGSRVRLVLGSSFDGEITPAAVGDAVPDRLRTTPSDAGTTSSVSSSSAASSNTASSSTSSTPSSRSSAPSATRSASSTPPSTAVIDTSNVQAVNAGDATCA